MWKNGEVLCCDRAILCHYIVGQTGKIFCRDRVFLCRYRVGQGKKKLCCNRVGQGKEKLCRNRAILCRNRVGQGRENSVATEDFYVETKLATTKSSAAHDKAGRAKAGVHDSVAPCCVATEEVMRAR